MTRTIQPVYGVDPRGLIGRTYIPATAMVLGVVRDPKGRGAGALVRVLDGTYMYITGSCVRQLPQKEAAEAAAKLAN